MNPRRPSTALTRFILAAFVLIQLGLALAPGLHGKTLTIVHAPGGAQVHFVDRHAGSPPASAHMAMPGHVHHTDHAHAHAHAPDAPEHAHHQHSLDCPLCLAAFAPPPETGSPPASPPPAALTRVTRTEPARCGRIVAAQPARGPPV